MFNSEVEEAYKQLSLITDFVPTPDGLKAILVKNDHLFETNSSSERSDSDIESIYEPWDVDDALLEAIFNCQLDGSQEITEIHKIKRRAELETSTELVPWDDRFNSEIYSSPSANNVLNDTEALTSLEFLYHETLVSHLLTYIYRFGILDQFTPNGVWGVFVTILRFIYGLYRLNFFFL